MNKQGYVPLLVKFTQFLCVLALAGATLLTVLPFRRYAADQDMYRLIEWNLRVVMTMAPVCAVVALSAAAGYRITAGKKGLRVRMWPLLFSLGAVALCAARFYHASVTWPRHDP